MATEPFVTLPGRTVARVTGAVLPDGLPLVRTAVRRGLMSLFGPPVVSPETPRTDDGVLGRGAVSWRVLGEPGAIAGGLRGLLVQTLHPLATAGVVDHSAFRDDPLGRLARTSAWVTTSTFGTSEATRQAAGRVRGAHQHVRGTAADGRAYAADAPHLLAWVQIALTSSFLVAHDLWAPVPLTPEERDRFVLEQSRLAALLDPRVDLGAIDLLAVGRGDRDEAMPMVADGTLPTDASSLRALLIAYEPELHVGDQGQDVLEFLRRPPLPVFARVPYRVMLGGAAGSLDAAHRHLVGMAVNPVVAGADVARAGALLTTMRTVNGLSPALRAARAA